MMKLIKNEQKIRCEMGVCHNFADYSIALDRVGIRSRIHICKDCLGELKRVIDEEDKKKKFDEEDKKNKRDEEDKHKRDEKKFDEEDKHKRDEEDKKRK